MLFFLPRNEQNKIVQQKQQELNSLTLLFIKECEDKYDELESLWQKEDQMFRERVIDSQQKRCETIKNTTEADFDMEQWWYCWNGQLVFYSKEEFTKPCIRFRLNQLTNVLNEL